MKQFACGSIVAGCHAVFIAASEDRILAQVADHAHRDHDIAEMTPELADAVRANIRPTA